VACGDCGVGGFTTWLLDTEVSKCPVSRTCLRNKFWELNVIEHTEHEKKPWRLPAEGVIAVVGRIKVRVDGPVGAVVNV